MYCECICIYRTMMNYVYLDIWWYMIQNYTVCRHYIYIYLVGYEPVRYDRFLAMTWTCGCSWNILESCGLLAWGANWQPIWVVLVMTSKNVRTYWPICSYLDGVGWRYWKTRTFEFQFWDVSWTPSVSSQVRGSCGAEHKAAKIAFHRFPVIFVPLIVASYSTIPVDCFRKDSSDCSCAAPSRRQASPQFIPTSIVV